MKITSNIHKNQTAVNIGGKVYLCYIDNNNITPITHLTDIEALSKGHDLYVHIGKRRIEVYINQLGKVYNYTFYPKQNKLSNFKEVEMTNLIPFERVESSRYEIRVKRINHKDQVCKRGIFGFLRCKREEEEEIYVRA